MGKIQKGGVMSTGSKEAIAMIAGIIKEMKLKQELTEIAYRSDYQDYQVILDDNHHCEIREKLIEDFMSTKSGDAKKQIQFKLGHPIAWEDWERPVKPVSQDDKPVVDDPV